jgi:Cys-tRNA synthase (O-phospho-L-seryl-tRNA:Cys-tRNA synthase)
MAPLTKVDRADEFATFLDTVATDLNSGSKTAAQVVSTMETFGTEFQMVVTDAEAAYAEMVEAVETHQRASEMIDYLANHDSSSAIISELRNRGFYSKATIDNHIEPHLF